MEKSMKILGLAMALTIILTVIAAGAAFAANSTPQGPAPNSGDCIPDGSGLDSPNGPNADIGSGTGPAGPAPNAGDGIPDGSGF